MYVSRVPLPLIAEYNFSTMIVGGFEIEVLPLFRNVSSNIQLVVPLDVAISSLPALSRF